jgi:hypothetical protein
MIDKVTVGSVQLRIVLLSFTIVLGLYSFAASEGYAQTANTSAEDTSTMQLKFEEPVNLTNNLRDSVYAQVASHGNDVYMVWKENPPSGPVPENSNLINYDIFIKKSVDGGLTFGKEINLSNNQGFSEHPQIAVSGNNVHVAWIDNSPSMASTMTPENKRILFRNSNDEGNTFGKTITLSNTSNSESYNQEIAAAANNVYVVWQETPLPAADQDSAKSGSFGTNADNESDRSSVREQFSSISFVASVDSGETFKKAKSISSSAFKSYPKIAAFDNSVFMTWNVGIIGDNSLDLDNTGIFFTKSLDTGKSFSDTMKLNSNWNSVGESQVAAYGNNLYVVWGGNPDDKIVGNLFFSKSTDKGDTFSAARPLTEKNTLNVEVTAENDIVYVAWQGVLPNGNEEILIKSSLDSGSTFTNTNENISRNDGISECTSIDISENTKKVYVAWEDDSPGNHDILFAHSI